MKHLTENIRYEIAGYGHYKVYDTLNNVSVIVPSWIIDDCDPEDIDSLEHCLSLLRAEYAKKDEPRYNVEVVINRNAPGGMAETRYYDGEGYSCDPLPYSNAWPADEVLDVLKSAKELFMDAWTEEVEPFMC